MRWLIVGFWLGGSILFVPLLCLRELLIGRKEKVDRTSSQQVEVDHASPPVLRLAANVATASEG